MKMKVNVRRLPYQTVAVTHSIDPLDKRSMLHWMDKRDENGDMKFLVLQTTDGSSVPKNPFIVGKSLCSLADELSEPGKALDNGKKTPY